MKNEPIKKLYLIFWNNNKVKITWKAKNDTSKKNENFVTSSATEIPTTTTFRNTNNCHSQLFEMKTNGTFEKSKKEGKENQEKFERKIREKVEKV